MGQSAGATQALLRLLEAPRRDLEGFGTGIERLQRAAALLQSRQSPERRVEPGPSREEQGDAPYRATRAGPAWRGRAPVGCPSCHGPKVLAQMQA